MQQLKERSELLFVYDATDINPNGDPLNENKPRMDEESGHCLITDVRLKRTIRDYILEYKKGQDGLGVFVREVRKDDGTLKSKEEFVADDYKNDPDAILEQCIDIRLFGATLAIGSAGGSQRPITFTGPVQFRMGRSLHRVGEPQFHQGNTVMPSGSGKKQGTFRDEYLLPYGLFGFYGVANQMAGETTKLRESDVPVLLESMWHGTKNLITRSKVGQMPRLLIQVVYNEPHFLMGELDKRIKVVTDMREEELRDVSQLHLDITGLVNELQAQKARVKTVNIALDSRLKLQVNGQEISAENAFAELPYEPLSF